MGGGVNDLIAVAGDLVLDGELHFTALASFGEGTYTLLTYTGDLTDQGLAIASLPPGFDPAASEIDTSVLGEVRLQVAALAPPSLPSILEIPTLPRTGLLLLLLALAAAALAILRRG